MPKNRLISQILKEISDFLEFKGENIFKVRAYRDAKKIIENLPYEINNAKDLQKLKGIYGIGDGIINRVKEIVEKGESSYLDTLKKEYPIDLEELLSIPGLGIKKIRLFYDALGIKNIEDLKDALYSGELVNLPRVGKKIIENINKSIEFIEKNRGFSLPIAYDLLQDIIFMLKKHSILYYITGEIRRKKEFIRYFDIILLDTKNVYKVLNEVKIIKEENLQFRYLTFKFRDLLGRFIIVEPNLLWHSLFISTGEEKHVLQVLNTYYENNLSFWNEKFKREKDIYERVNLPFIPPILREGRDEFINYCEGCMFGKKEIFGEFHVHSNWSDGNNSIPEILEIANKKGYKYIGISDHSVSLSIANGLSCEDVLRKEGEIMRLREKNPKVYPLFGAEVDIGPDGRLDYPDEILEKFDYVIAAIHTNFGKDVQENTKRIISALKNPYVVAFAHPTGRELGIRPGYRFNREEVFKEAAKNNVFLEINGTPRRMDLDSYEIYKIKNMGIDLNYILSSDAHFTNSFSNIDNSLIIANKAFVKRKNILNTYDLKSVISIFKGIRKAKKGYNKSG